MKCIRNSKRKALFAIPLALILFLSAVLGVYHYMIPDEVSYFAGEDAPTYLFADVKVKDSVTCGAEEAATAFSEISYEADYRLFGILPVKHVTLTAYKDVKLYPGGMPFGVKFFTSGVLVVGFCDVDTEGGQVNPAYDAGLRLKDVITHVGGRELSGAVELTELVEASSGAPIEIRYTRGEGHFTTTVTPAKSASDGKYKTGIWVRDSGAGIGTVSFIDPESNYFAGLGHGICDTDTGKLLPIERGSVVDVTISGITKGVSGTPGEIKGFFNSGKIGSLLGNNECGVFGILASVPKNVPTEPLPIGLKGDLREGKAYIYCTLDTNEVTKYDIEILDIDRGAEGGKCFTVKITDPDLLEKTGGIIQGMSGSPIIQDGKLVGAVTHVLVGDPSRGYGIFIENMLNASHIPDLQNAA